MILKGITIRQRLMRIILLTSGAVLTVCFLVYFAYEYRSIEQAMVRQLKTLGEVISSNSTAALAFDNKDDAKEILSALAADKHIVAACLYDKNGTIFTTYPDKLPMERFPPAPLTGGYKFEHRHLNGFQAVMQGNTRLGTLYLSTDLNVLYERLRLYAIIICLIVITSYGLAYILSLRLRETILKPVFSLVEASRIISANGDYSTRAKKYKDDELGFLTDAFNSMLATIEVQNEEIKSFNLLLEKKVSERTNELEQANNVLKEQKEFVEAIINSSVDSIAVFNRNLEFVVVNNNAEKIYKLDHGTILGKNVIDLFPAVKEFGMYDDLVRALNGETVHRLKYRSPALNRYFENFYIPLKDVRNNVYGILVIGHDVTDITETNDQLQKVNNELVKSNLELEQFAYIASHDLQEPLRKIQLFLELAKTNIHDPLVAEEYFKKVNASAERMRELIVAVLNYGRSTRSQQEYARVDLNNTFESVKVDLELVIAEKEAALYCDKLPVIEGIPFQLNQLFLNLVSNSLKFCKAKPVIHIYCAIISNQQLNSRLESIKKAEYLKEGVVKEFVMLKFQDNGIGIESQYTGQLFAIFKRLHGKENYPGTGIGLALVKKIVESHNGFVHVESNPGEGSAFYIYLPTVQKL